MKNIVGIFFFMFLCLSSAQEEKRLALVIGNANYDKGELKNPVNDARLIASTLDSLNFDVILKENLSTKRDMTAAIREFGNKRSEYDVAFVYYAGHGIQVEDENFLLPTKEVFEGEFDVLDYGVSVQNIMRYLEAQTNEVNILILDACRDNPFESAFNTTRSLKGNGLAKMPPPTGSLIAFSTDSGQTAPDGKGENSIYTLSLAKNMLLEDTSIDQVFRNVRSEVLEESGGAQRPVEATQLTGQTFYLNPQSIDNFLSKIEGSYNSGKYEEVLFLALNEENSLKNESILRFLINSFQALGRNEELNDLLDNMIQKQIDDTSLLEAMLQYYTVDDMDSSKAEIKKSYEISSKIYELDNSLINKTRKDFYEYMNLDERYVDNISRVEFEKNQGLIDVLTKQKQNLYSLTNNINKENQKVFHSYIYKISRALIRWGFRKLTLDERSNYFHLGLSSIKELIKLSPNNAKYYESFSDLVYEIKNTQERERDKGVVIEALKKEIGVYDAKEIDFFRDSLIKKAYGLNRLNNTSIIGDYFNRAIREEPKASFHMDYEEALSFINGLVEKFPKNISFLRKRAVLHRNNENYELEVYDKKQVLLLTDSSNTYDVVSAANDVAYTIINDLKNEREGVELLEKYVSDYGIDTLSVRDMNTDDEKYVYGEIFNTMSEFYFSENNFDSARKYIKKTFEIWKNNNSVFEGKGFDYFFETDESEVFYDYIEEHGYWTVINYLVNIYAYYSGANLVGAYLDWLNSDYNNSLEKIKESLFYNPYIHNTRVGYDLMNLLVRSGGESDLLLFLEKLNKRIQESSKDSWTGSTYNKHLDVVHGFLFEAKIGRKNASEIKDFLNNKEYKYLFNTLDMRTVINIENKSSDTDFVINATVLEVFNVLITKGMNNEAGVLLDHILENSSLEGVNSVEFFYKAAYVKYLNDKKFESFALLSDLKKLISKKGFIGVEAHDIGYLEYALPFTFDGVSILKNEDVVKLEELIRS